MQVSFRQLGDSFRSFAGVTSLGALVLFALCIEVASASAQVLPIVVTGPTTQIGDFHFNGAGGGWLSGQAPLGGTFVVGANGHVIVGAGYGSGVFEITPTGTQTVLANFSNSNAAGMDKYGNVYIARDYGDTIYKLPFNSSTGTYSGFTTAPTANCAGGTQDTAACVFAPGTKATIDAGKTAGGGSPGFTSLFFDAQGNFFFVTDTTPGSKAGGNANTIYECSAQCQTETDGSGTNPPVVVYADNKAIGPVAVDPWGNLFFSDGASNGPNNGTASYLEELTFSGSGYASSPTLLQTYNTTAAYNGLCGVAVDGGGNVYLDVPNDGVFLLPNSQSGPNLAGIYKVSNQGGKGIALDPRGILYAIGYSSSLGNDVMMRTPLGSVSFAATAVAAQSASVSATIIDNAAGSTPTLTLTATEFGMATTEFAGTAASSCSKAVGISNGTWSPALSFTGQSCSTNLTFTPNQVGERNAALIVTDAPNSASGVAALSGVGQGAFVNLDPGGNTGITAGLTAPTSIIADPMGDLFVADSGAGKVYMIPAGSTTLTPVGSGFTTPTALAFDAAGNLYIADPGVPAIFSVKNTGTTGGFVPGTQKTFLEASALFNGKGLSSPVALAFGPDQTLYIADSNLGEVLSYNVVNQTAGLTNANAANGLKTPAGIAVDSGGNLYVADDSLNQIFIFSSSGAMATVKASAVKQTAAVAVDASGSVLIADKLSGSIVRIPMESGALNASDAIVIESNPQSAVSIFLDGSGNLYTADLSGKSVYSIQRTAGSINAGTVQDGLIESSTLYVENAGNQTATMATPFITEPANTMFTLTGGTINGCTDGGSGPAGTWCSMTAAFAPLVGTPGGPQAGTATLNFSPSGTATVTISGTASLSSVLSQTITGFTPATPMLIGQQITLSATGGASGNPITFKIDAASPCSSCATVVGSTLTATSVGTIIVDANQAGGQANGNQYAAAPQVQATIAINNVTPAGVPALIMNQLTWLNATGSFTDGQNPQGGSFAVTQNGEIVVGTTYGSKVYFVNAQTGATIGTPVSFNGPGGITIDSKNNLYISHLYNSIIYKIPFVKGAYVPWSDNPTPAPPPCTGSDVAECTFVTPPSTPTRPNSGGVKAIAFDPSGNFYMVSEPDNANTLTGQSYLYECDTNCQPAGTGTVLYADPNGISQIAFDPWGNLFFTDANYNVKGTNSAGNSGASSTNLNELVYTPGTGFASTPTILQTFTNTGGGGNFDDMLASVAVHPSTGTIYYGVLYDGTYAIPNSQSGGPQIASQYAVSSQGAKALQPDSLGNLYLVANTGGADTVGFLAINNLNAGTGPVLGTPVTASATVMDNALGCSSTTPVTLAFTSSNPQFSANAGTSCSSIGMGDATLLNAVPAISSYPVTITFGPTSGGPQSATLSVSDTTNGGIGTTTVSGTGQEIPQTITFTGPATTTYTYAPGLTVNFSATGGASNNPVTFSLDATSTATGTIAGNVLTVTQAGTIVIDANQPGGLVNNVYYQDASQAQLSLIINKAAQSITFAPQGAPATYAPGLTINLSATPGASSKPLVFSVDEASSTGAGTISGNVLTVTQAGNIVVDADQAADINYNAAPQVQQTFVVNQAAQTVTFIPLSQPLHYIQGGLQVQISANGGATNNPVAFSVDPSSPVTGSFSNSTVTGSTSTATLTIKDQAALANFPANILIDANQSGNTNYTAAPQVAESIPLLRPLPTQTITFNNPTTQVAGTPFVLNATASSGFPVSFAATPSNVCTVTSSASGWTANFVNGGANAATCTITAVQPGDNIYYAAAPSVSQTFAVNPSGQAPDMKTSLSLSSVTIAPGTVGLTQITVNSVNNFTGSVSFACSGAPSGYSCSFNPSSITAFTANATTGLPNGTSGSTQLSIAGSSTATQRGNQPWIPVSTFAGVALCFLGLNKNNRLRLFLLTALVISGAGFFTACGGSSSTKTVQPTTSTITITATSGMTTKTMNLTLIVQ